jgi:Phage protein (N4 Gp49/phage Sf6 gene 66) family
MAQLLSKNDYCVLCDVHRGERDGCPSRNAACHLFPMPKAVPDSLQVTDAASKAVAIAPRVSLQDIEDGIAARFDYTAGQASFLLASQVAVKPHVEVPDVIDALNILSICVLVMFNGFVVIGKSAPASRENFNAELGRKFAYEDAIRQLWPLMGFALRDRLAELSKGVPAKQYAGEAPAHI